MQKYRDVIALSDDCRLSKTFDQEEKTFAVGLTRPELRFCLILVFLLEMYSARVANPLGTLLVLYSISIDVVRTCL